MTFDHTHWQRRLDELLDTHRVPGASLAVLADGRIHELAGGVLHRGTGVAATTDSIFQIGSITKVHTATLIMQLADSGELDLDRPVIDTLPEFGTPDPEATKIITPRHLLSHTGGMTCDFTEDTGRGDDCLARYVTAARDVPLDCPPGTGFSYGSSGYVVLGRLAELITGKTWDAALQERLCEPLGLTHTVSLPEDALRFRVAMSHLGEPGEWPDPAASWNPLPRSSGPYGGVLCATAADVVRLAKLHLDGGVADDGTRILSPQAVSAMQRRVIDSPDKWSVSADGWGLGWTLYDWHRTPGFGHDGATIGQYSFLRVVPDHDVAVALLTNGGSGRRLYSDLMPELLAELAAVRMPPAFGPPEQPVSVDLTAHLGSYRRAGVALTVTGNDETARMRYEFVDGLAGIAPPLEADLVPVSENVFAVAGTGPFGDDWMPLVFSTLSDGTACAYVGMRATPKINT